MKIVLDAGHGYNTPGKRTPDGSMREWEFNNAVANEMKALLAQYEGVSVIFTHDITGKVDVPLATRTNAANATKADVLVSIHANAATGKWGSAHGIETFVYKKSLVDANKLAEAVQSALIKATGLRDRGVKEGNLHMVRETKMTAILVECGFMDNRAEAELLKSSAYRKKCAEAIVAGLAQHYKLKRKEAAKVAETKAVPKPQSVSAWAKDAQAWVMVQGISDGSRPLDTVTRQEVWAMLYRMSAKK